VLCPVILLIEKKEQGREKYKSRCEGQKGTRFELGNNEKGRMRAALFE
jgi:hypothetical protein